MCWTHRVGVSVFIVSFFPLEPVGLLNQNIELSKIVKEIGK